MVGQVRPRPVDAERRFRVVLRRDHHRTARDPGSDVGRLEGPSPSVAVFRIVALLQASSPQVNGPARPVITVPGELANNDPQSRLPARQRAGDLEPLPRRGECRGNRRDGVLAVAAAVPDVRALSRVPLIMSVAAWVCMAFALTALVPLGFEVLDDPVEVHLMPQIALTLVLTAFTLIFLIVVVPLWSMAWNAEQYMMGYLGLQQPLHSLGTDFPTLVALLVCLIPTTIGALLAAIGIAGMNRALQANIIAKSGKAVETAGDIDIVLLDKTGTITEGNRRATRFLPVKGYSAAQVGELAALASAADETPEGKSIVSIYVSQSQSPVSMPQDAEFITFSASTRMSGINLPDGRRIRKGAADAVANFVREQGGSVPSDVSPLVDGVASRGATPLVVADGPKVVGVVVLEDILKPSMKERFDRLRKMGLRTVMITGDNPLTAATIAKQAGVDDFLAEATPEDKLKYIRKEQAEGKLIAMMGDGTNDAPALAQADVAVAMNAGTQAAKEAGNMVDLDSDPTKIIEVVEIGKQLLMTRGALTTFSIANDVAKYFAIIPALFAATLPWLKTMDIMHLHSPTSAILSAVIFNAIIIPLLIPVALKGVRYEPLGADALLRRNLLICGLGGVVVPFIGIKLIDVVMAGLHLVS